MKLLRKDRTLTPSWSLLEPSFNLFRKNFLLLCYIAIAATAATSLDIKVNENMQLVSANGADVLTNMLVLAGVIWLVAFTPVLYYVELQLARGKSIDFMTAVRNGLQYFWRVLGLVVLMSLIILGGLLLFIVPGLIFIRRYSLAPYYLIDKNVSISEALRLSAAASKPIAGYIWGVIGVSVLVAFSSQFLLMIPVIGVVVSAIFSFVYVFAFAFRYLEIEDPASVAKTLPQPVASS